ncbi:MAG: 30S ribosomal protein S3 [Deltaproteobacteria bacterium]|nr:30S ribosomal protein S3 [Deltaproteobacteria bacterium]MCL5791677.1 30S ribosomal protein S3 [Deltaproteobacteria bacterium]
MGQKTNPIGLRLGIIKNWNSRWFAEKDYAKELHEDHRIRTFLKKKLYHAAVSSIIIERAVNKIKINIHSSRVGLIIGKKGTEIEALKAELAKMLLGKEVTINMFEIRKPELDAQLVAENIALQIERRISYRRAMKKGISSALKFGAKGIKVMVAGRLSGAEIARTEWYREGRVPLQTLRADIDYGFAEAFTTYGVTGIKVWIFKGEMLGKEGEQETKLAPNLQ